MGGGLILIAAVAGYLVGSTPTANLIARSRGIDLRSSGSTNPGANNARQLGGYGLAVAVLAVEAIKGAVAVLIGAWLANDSGAVLAGLGAVGGNVYNVWYRFEGGKGLAATLGVLAAAWPPVVVPLALVMGVTAWLTRSSGQAVMVAMVTINIFAVAWVGLDLPNAWGVSPTPILAVLSVGLSLILLQKHLADALRPGGHSESPEQT